MRAVSKVETLLIAALLVVSLLLLLQMKPTDDQSEIVPSVAAPGGTGFQEGTPTQREIDALRRTVEEERLARVALAQRVDQLQAQLDASERTPELPELANASGWTIEAHGQGSESDVDRADNYESTTTALTLDPTRLIAAGIGSSEADQLRESYGEMWMEWLDLRRLSERGEITDQELIDEKTKIRDRYREELGDEHYDLMLSAGDRPNRVGISDVLQGSPAEGIGLEPGDIIYSYADERVFAPADVVRLTIEVETDATIPMVILRGGKEHHLSVPGGPLGAAIGEASSEPVRVN